MRNFFKLTALVFLSKILFSFTTPAVGGEGTNGDYYVGFDQMTETLRIINTAKGNAATDKFLVKASNNYVREVTGDEMKAALKLPVSYSGTTNASGEYTITFPAAYSVPPSVSPELPNNTNPNRVINVLSVSTTSCTVRVTQKNSVNLLSTDLLLAANVAVNAAAVDVIVLPK
jgi:hypothetical protein